MIIRRALLLTTVFGLGLSLASSLPQSQEADTGDQEAANAFLDKLVGKWRMEGRGRPGPEVPWYRTASTMNATRRLKDRAIVRDVDAPAIQMEAMDILWYDNQADEFTYVYLASNRGDPIIMVGDLTDDNEVTVYLEEPEARTVIRLVNENEMVAQDFRVDENGEEWMSREVMHYREK